MESGKIRAKAGSGKANEEQRVLVRAGLASAKKPLIPPLTVGLLLCPSAPLHFWLGQSLPKFPHYLAILRELSFFSSTSPRVRAVRNVP